MRKRFLAAAISLLMSSSFALKINAQTKAIFIEDLSTKNIATTAKSVFTEIPVYNKAGKLLYTVKRYDECSLPEQIDRMVRNQHTGFDITSVEEVVFPSGNNNIYYVHIANQKRLQTIKVCNGDAEVVNDYRKG